MDEEQGGSSPAAAGSPGNPLLLTDPRVMRALAHPARMEIWQHIGLEGPATATECAEVVGLSPSACSYHLRTLARYGFVEEDTAHPADGRERRWRAKISAINVPSATGTVAQRDAARLLTESVHASAEELETLKRRLTELLGEYRRLSPDARPPGTRRVLVTVDLVPWFPPPSSPPPDGEQP